MFLKAIYTATNEECYVNADFVVDIFMESKSFHLIDGTAYRYMAYTLFDGERRRYAISKAELERLLKVDGFCHYGEKRDEVM